MVNVPRDLFIGRASLARFGGQVAGFAGDLSQMFGISPLDRGHQEPLLKRHCYPM